MEKALMILRDIKINQDGLGLELHPNCVNDDVEQAIRELEELQNNTCTNCKHNKNTSNLSDEEHLSAVQICMGCSLFYPSKFESKETKC